MTAAPVPLDLWLWPLAPPCPPALAAHLSPTEAARAARFVNPDHGEAYRIGRGRLREILAQMTGGPPAYLDLRTASHGKPWLPGGPRFNLSHSGGWAALAVTQAPLDLGLDIEAFRPVEPGVAHRFFAPGENTSLAALPSRDWAAGFFRCWTRKEAVVKAVGDGLSIPLNAFDVTLAPGDAAEVTRMDPDLGAARDWRLTHLDLGPTFVGAIATRPATPLTITLREGQLPLPE